ncbi:hypothetical protein B2J93_347 [Marssonina coronariae]|uniref:Uncharacterized protein n=1 Tax=Diplocarpon coronariae TaxID=2795749 RepID=A0A218YXE4_9HELO|nr:hypothetical protein B2J93_347 [Marssonina coronariae]
MFCRMEKQPEKESETSRDWEGMMRRGGDGEVEEEEEEEVVVVVVEEGEVKVEVKVGGWKGEKRWGDGKWVIGRWEMRDGRCREDDDDDDDDEGDGEGEGDDDDDDDDGEAADERGPAALERPCRGFCRCEHRGPTEASSHVYVTFHHVYVTFMSHHPQPCLGRGSWLELRCEQAMVWSRRQYGLDHSKDLGVGVGFHFVTLAPGTGHSIWPCCELHVLRMLVNVKLAGMDVSSDHVSVASACPSTRPDTRQMFSDSYDPPG